MEREGNGRAGHRRRRGREGGGRDLALPKILAWRPLC